MARVQRIVIKIGSSSLAGDATPLHMPTICRLVKEICQLRDGGVEVFAGPGLYGSLNRKRVFGTCH